MAAPAEQQRLHNYLRLVPESKVNKGPAPADEVQDQVAGPSPMDQVLWFEDNDIFVQGILPFLNLTDLGPFARTCRRAYTAVTGDDGKSKGTSCLLKLGLRRRGTSRTNRHRDLQHQQHPHADPDDSELSLDSVSVHSDAEIIVHIPHRRHERNRNEPAEELHWEVKKYPSSAMVKPHCVRRVCVAVEHEEKQRKHVPDTVPRGRWFHSSSGKPPRKSLAYRDLVEDKILPLVHENTEQLQFSYMAGAFGRSKPGGEIMQNNLARCLYSAVNLQVLEIPAALAETKTIDRLLAANTAGTTSAPHSRCRWKKLHRLTVNGPLEIIRPEDPDEGKDMLFFKLLSCGGEDGEEAGTGQQLKELEVDLRWIARTRSNTLRLLSRTDVLNGNRVRAALLEYEAAAHEYEDAPRVRAAELAAQETFTRVFSHLERLTLQCGGRSLVRQRWFGDVLSTRMRNLHSLSLGLPRRCSPHTRRKKQIPAEGFGHVLEFLTSHLPPSVTTLELKNIDLSDVDPVTIWPEFLHALNVKILKLEDVTLSAAQSGVLFGFLQFERGGSVSLTEDCRRRLQKQVAKALKKDGSSGKAARIKASANLN